MGGGRRGLVLGSRTGRVRGRLPGVLSGRLALRCLGTSGGGRPLRSAAALADGVRRRQYGAARPGLAVSARHHCQLWHRRRSWSRPRCSSPRRPVRQRAARGLRRSPGRRPVAGRCHALVPGLAPPDGCRREHHRFQAVDRRLLSRGTPSNLRCRAWRVHHRGLPDGRRAGPPLPLWRLHDAGPHQAGIRTPFVRGLRRHPGAHGGLLHRARGVRPLRVVLGSLARAGRGGGAAAAAGRRAAGDAEHVHVVSLADPDLAQRELRVGSAGAGLAVRAARVHAGQSIAARHGLADRGESSPSTSCTSSSPAPFCCCWFPRSFFRGPCGLRTRALWAGVCRRGVRRDHRRASSGCPAFPRSGSMARASARSSR